MLGIAIHCIQHSQAMLERGVCELAHSFFHLLIGIKFVRVLFSKKEQKFDNYLIQDPRRIQVFVKGWGEKAHYAMYCFHILYPIYIQVGFES